MGYEILHAALSYQRDEIAFINKFMIPSPTPLIPQPSFFTLKQIYDTPPLTPTLHSSLLILHS